MSRAGGDGTPQVIGGIGHAGRGTGLPPEFEDCIGIFRLARTDDQTVVYGPDHQRLYAIARQAFEPSIGAIRRAAMRCWAGQQPYITRADLLAELEATPDLPPHVWAEFEALLRR